MTPLTQRSQTTLAHHNDHEGDYSPAVLQASKEQIKWITSTLQSPSRDSRDFFDPTHTHVSIFSREPVKMVTKTRAVAT